MARNADSSAPAKDIYLIGNPNSGKTSLFNALTGERRRVGNWPGVTVDRIEGLAHLGSEVLRFIDLPGTYSLNPNTPEEGVVLANLDLAASGIVVNVVDASNLERNLFLTLQLLELGIRPLIALNCMDLAVERGICVDVSKLAQRTGCLVFPTVARTGQGVAELLRILVALPSGTDHPEAADFCLPDAWREAVHQLLLGQGSTFAQARPGQRQQVLRSLLTRPGAEEDVTGAVDAARTELYAKLSASPVAGASGSPPKVANLACHLAENRYHRIDAICRAAVSLKGPCQPQATEGIDRVLMHQYLGLPLFAAMMAFVFWSTFALGEYPQDWLLEFFTWLKRLGEAYLPAGLFRDLLLDGVLQGVGGVIVFLPSILILFFWIALLEDSGYMARAAFLMDRFMQSIGLHGRAFIPFLMGFGCNVPAVMATRVLEHRGQRLLSLLLLPLVSCAARFPVLVLMCGTFFPEHPGLWMFVVYAINLLVLVALGWIGSRVLGSRKDAVFLLEMPTYRFPTWKSIAGMLGDKTWHFLEKAGTVILAGSILIWLLSAFPRNVPLSRDYDGEIEKLQVVQEQQGTAASAEMILELTNRRDQEIMEGRYLARIGKAIHVLFAPLGFSWRETVALIPGFLAKESVISTLSVLYLPIHSDLGQAMRLGGMTPLHAFVFMLFTLLYIPCLATIGVVWRESGSVLFAAGVLLSHVLIAWITGFLIYQGASLYNAPQSGAFAGIGDYLVPIIIGVIALGFLLRRGMRDLSGSACHGCPKSGACAAQKSGGEHEK